MRILAGNVCRIALLLTVLLVCLSGAAPTRTRAASSALRVYLPLLIGVSQPAVAQQVLALVNQQRQQHGCAALVFSSQLTTAANVHSQDMALHDRFSHTGSDGSTMLSRIVATGYGYSLLAENLAAGPATAKEAMDDWMSSAGHRANILNCDLHELGVGIYMQLDDQANVRLDNGQLGGPFRYYWTQDFGSH